MMLIFFHGAWKSMDLIDFFHKTIKIFHGIHFIFFHESILFFHASPRFLKFFRVGKLYEKTHRLVKIFMHVWHEKNECAILSQLHEYILLHGTFLFFHITINIFRIWFIFFHATEHEK